MDWPALLLSIKLALATALILLPIGLVVGRWLALSRHPARSWVEALVMLPLVLPPTVLGFYLLVAMGRGTVLGDLYERIVGQTLAFSFEGLLLASVIVNLPFALMPMQRAFESIAPELHDAARSCGLSRWQRLWRIDIPLAKAGIVSGLLMTAMHTLGEFGVVLMVGGAIPSETKTIAVSIYDRVQAFDMAGAGAMSALLLLASMVTLWVSVTLLRSGAGPAKATP